MPSTMRITVDANSAEAKLMEVLQSRFSATHAVTRQPLHLGDVALERDVGDGGIERLLIERKTVPDWISSLQGTRYHEQKTRYLATKAAAEEAGERVLFAYVIEGAAVLPMTGATRGFSNKAANAAMIKTELRDGIPVLRSVNIVDTAEVCAYIADKFAKGEFSAEAAADKARNVVVGLGERATRKRENLEDPKALLAAMLTCVPGMSKAKADALVERFPSAAELGAASPKEIGDVKHKARRIGDALGGRIAAVFARRV